MFIFHLVFQCVQWKLFTQYSLWGKGSWLLHPTLTHPPQKETYFIAVKKLEKTDELSKKKCFCQTFTQSYPTCFAKQWGKAWCVLSIIVKVFGKMVGRKTTLLFQMLRPLQPICSKTPVQMFPQRFYSLWSRRKFALCNFMSFLLQNEKTEKKINKIHIEPN